MAEITGGEVIARMLKAEGVEVPQSIFHATAEK